jgi:hypothetical protein
MQQHQRYYQKGIGLIEIAIVLVIVGLLIGAIFQGRKLVENAKLNAVVANLHKIQMNVREFKEKYGFMPGDFPFASRDIHPSVVDGNGSGVLNGNPFSIVSPAGLFWVHLAALEEIFIQEQQELMFGDTLMNTGFGGGYTIVQDPSQNMPGAWIVVGEKENDSGEAPLFTPEQAAYIDKKISNGHPAYGQLRALGKNRVPGKCIVDNRYNLTNKEQSCVLYFRLEN